MKKVVSIIKKQSIILWIFILAMFMNCNGKESLRAKDAKNLSEFPKTEFLPTMEHRISDDKNSVYCATLLFAWDGIRKAINAPFTISDEYYDLKFLHQSTSFENVLQKKEYKVEIKVGANTIKSRAEFEKSLPFAFPLKNHTSYNLFFDGQYIPSFGMVGYGKDKQKDIVHIMYYKDNTDFIIKLLPKNKEHEIILYKTPKRGHTMAEMTAEINSKIAIGIVEKGKKETYWKYKYNMEDIVAIPKLYFNIETNYQTLEEKSFTSNPIDAIPMSWTITRAWQRTAFLLNEMGAEIKSEAEIIMSSSYIEHERSQPKLMVFNKPFLVLLKRTDAVNPYFALWIANTELMNKK